MTLESENSEIQQRVRDALDLLEDAHTAYTNAPITVRKQLNQAIFAGIFLGPEPTQSRADLNEPFASITHRADETPATQVAVVEPLRR